MNAFFLSPISGSELCTKPLGRLAVLLLVPLLAMAQPPAASHPPANKILDHSDALVRDAAQRRNRIQQARRTAPVLPAIAALGREVGAPTNAAEQAERPASQPQPAKPRGSAATTFIDNRSAACVNVRDFGAKGDGQSDDTEAFVKALAARRAVCVPNGDYRVDTLSLPDSAVISGESRATVIRPLVEGQKGVFHAAGSSFKQKVTHVQIRNLMVYNPFQHPPTGAYAVRFDYAEKCTLQNVMLVGFYDNLIILNSVFIDLFASESGYAHHTNVFANWTDDSSGPYFGGWLYFDHFRALGSLGPSSVDIENYASVTMREVIVVGNKQAGIHVGQTKSKTDRPTFVVIDNCEFDSNGGTGLALVYVRDSIITNSWFSSGRDQSSPGVLLEHCSTITVSQNIFFWNGSEGLRMADTSYSSVTGNSSTANKTAGIGLERCRFNVIERNVVSSEQFNAMGYAQQRGIEEGAGSGRNVVIGNVVRGSRISQINARGEGTVSGFNISQ